MQIDWLEFFNEQFCNDKDIPYLKRDRFYGKLVINFQNGEPRTTNTEKCHLSKNEQERRRLERTRSYNVLHPGGSDAQL